MKTASNNLFQLIKNLTQSEKRYFKCFAQSNERKKGNNYIKLFDAIARQKEYDETKLKGELKKEHFISYLSTEKIHLYNFILKSLAAYGSGYDDHERIIELYQQAAIQSKKNLDEDALKYLQKAKKIAISGEWFPILIQICKLEQSILNRQSNLFSNKRLKENFSLLKNALSCENEITKHTTINNLVSSNIYHLNIFQDKNKIAALEKKILDYFAIKKNELNKSITAKTLENVVLSRFYNFSGDTKKAFQYSKAIISQFEFQKNYKKEDYFYYMVNHIYASLASQNYDEAKKTIDEIEKQDYIHIVGETKFEKSIFWSQLSYYMLTNEWDNALDYIEKKEENIIAIWNLQPSAELTVGAINAVKVYFIKKQYSKAIKWLFRFFFMGDLRIKQRIDLIENAYILYMISLFELEKNEILENALGHIKKKLQKLEASTLVRIQIPEFLKSILVLTAEKKPLQEEYITFKSSIYKSIEENTLELNRLNNSFFMAWIESKIEGLSIEQYFKQKNSI